MASPEIYHLPATFEADNETRWRLEAKGTHLLEQAMLTGPAQDFPHAGIDPRVTDAVREEHARQETELGTLIRRPTSI
jgi:hypothetical protein